jgi:hypothetical protein
VTRRTLPIVLLLLVGLVLPAQSSARKLTVYDRMLIEYVDKGRLSACKYTENELKTAKNAIPEDYQQYGGSIISALDDAIAARAQGQCDKKKQAAAPAQAGTTPPPAAGTQVPPPPASAGAAATPGQTAAPVTGAPAQAQEPPQPVAEAAPAPAISADDSVTLAARSGQAATDAPFPMLLLAILAGLLALALATFGVVRWFAWEPAWAVRLRHAAGEAGWRASSTFAEFTDFVRLGR